jgi:hypothetical protein
MLSQGNAGRIIKGTLKVPRKSATSFMLEFVQEYLNGTNSRLDFDLDFNYNLIRYYEKMERANPDLAECFLYYIGEQGFDKSEGLTDIEHKKLIRTQFKEFQSAMRDGFF